MSVKIREYLFSFAPLFVAWFILFLVNVSFSSIMLFVVAYLWHLFLVFPTTPENMRRQGYRFAFVRLIYVFYVKLNTWINRRHFFIIESILRALGPCLFMALFHLCFGGVNFFLLLMGSIFFELIYFSRRTFEGRVPPPLP